MYNVIDRTGNVRAIPRVKPIFTFYCHLELRVRTEQPMPPCPSCHSELVCVIEG